MEAEVSSRTGIKSESDEKKPVVKDSEANTVKSGKTHLSMSQSLLVGNPPIVDHKE